MAPRLALDLFESYTNPWNADWSYYIYSTWGDANGDVVTIPTYDDTTCRYVSTEGAGFHAFNCFGAYADTGSWTGNSWLSGFGSPTGQRLHIDLGSAKIVDKFLLDNGHNSGASTDVGAKAFTFWGSNDATAFTTLVYATDTNWTQLTTNISVLYAHDSGDWASHNYVGVRNTTAYRYYAWKFGSNYGNGSYTGVRRIKPMLTKLFAQPEATIKTQGSGSLKCIATTGALNIYVKKDITSGTCDLSGVSYLTFDFRASRTGSNVKISFTSNSVVTEFTPLVSVADTWQKHAWYIGGVADANKADVVLFTITVTNADVANIFYIDNFVISTGNDIFGIVG